MTVLANLKNAKTVYDLAKMLGFTPSGLTFVLYKLHPLKKYKTFTIPKKGGGFREINAPIGQLKLLQRRLANVLYACRSELEKSGSRAPISHGFRKGLSIVTNAKCHRRKRHVLNIDIKDFFPSFNFGRVRGYFISNKDFGLHPSIATLVAQIACYDNMLPQGSPCSPIISDLLAQILDGRLVRLAKANDTFYSRYADDLTFSSTLKVSRPICQCRILLPWECGTLVTLLKR